MAHFKGIQYWEPVNTSKMLFYAEGHLIKLMSMSIKSEYTEVEAGLTTSDISL